MWDKYLQEFVRENLRKTSLGIIGIRRQDNIKIDLKWTEYGYVDWSIWLRIESSGGKFWTISWNLEFQENVSWLVLGTLFVSSFVSLSVSQSVSLHLENSSKPHVKMFPLNAINIDHKKPFSFIPYISLKFYSVYRNVL